MTDSCPLCGGSENEPMFDEKGHTVVSCDTCDLLFITPYPRQSHDVYEKVSDYSYDDLTLLPPERHYESSCRRYSWLFPRIRPHCEKAASVLDVGCGTGRLLELLGHDFPQLQRLGLELNRKRAEFARSKAGCDVLSVPLQQLDRTGFDVITLMDLFSHVPDLNRFFKSVHDHLAPKGLVILKVGEFAKTARRNAVFDWEIPDHLQFLGMRTVDYLAHQHNFEVVVHDREPLANEIFSKVSLRSPGRSAARNRVKNILSMTPGVIPLLRLAHNVYTKKSALSSFIVLRKKIGT